MSCRFQPIVYKNVSISGDTSLSYSSCFTLKLSADKALKNVCRSFFSFGSSGAIMRAKSGIKRCNKLRNTRNERGSMTLVGRFNPFVYVGRVSCYLQAKWFYKLTKTVGCAGEQNTFFILMVASSSRKMDRIHVQCDRLGRAKKQQCYQYIS